MYLQGFQKRSKMTYPLKNGKVEETNTRIYNFDG